MKLKIKKGDKVVFRTGTEKGKSGTVLKVYPKSSRVLVEGLNMRKKHQKATRSGTHGQIVERATPVHISNVGIADKGKPSRVHFDTKSDAKGAKKVRMTKSGTVL